MTRLARKANRLLAVVLMVTLAATGTALAEKPAGDKSDKQHQQKSHEAKGSKGSGHSDARQSESMHGHTYFSVQHRDVIRNYYADQYRSGKCPPGLAKKKNGCMPPGQAKTWRIGQPLPRDVIFYDLPHSVTVQLGIPPAGNRFVRVASDILLIAVGSGMVIDAIEDLSNL